MRPTITRLLQIEENKPTTSKAVVAISQMAAFDSAVMADFL
jgi:hypothetical protein